VLIAPDAAATCGLDVKDVGIVVSFYMPSGMNVV